MKKEFKLWLTEKVFGKLWVALRQQMALGVVPGAGGVALLGDSITHFGKWDILFPGTPLRNFGIGGECAIHLLDRLEPVIALQPSQLFILIGINDITRGFTTDEIEANVDAMVAKLAGALPGCRIHLQAVMPAKRKLVPSIRALNERYRALAQRRSLNFIDLFPLFDDGTGQMRADLSYDVLHLNGAGYLVWRDTLARHL